ncbi:hypothetical protein APX70_04542 [Pseudomonas syringae pv. maculicola]|uniref:Uncharacterized protein n=1 Tax=Pseudomonas syringae pv. maculicola TaxID=59511 RepID=A0A3M2ZYY1_PSEYM|nr:hypothetical protein APX70_04542 [Pseudomonas syringae pv. maculicola]
MMRLRCGWPGKSIPNMSQTSRSYQLAFGQMLVMVGTLRSLSDSATLIITSLFRSIDSR